MNLNESIKYKSQENQATLKHQQDDQDIQESVECIPVITSCYSLVDDKEILTPKEGLLHPAQGVHDESGKKNFSVLHDNPGPREVVAIP